MSAQDGDVLARSLGGQIRVLPDVASLLWSLRTAEDDELVVLGAEVPAPRVLRFAAEVRAARPKTVVVLLRPEGNRLDRELARRAGVDAILLAGDFDAAGARCRELLAALSAGGR